MLSFIVTILSNGFYFFRLNVFSAIWANWFKSRFWKRVNHEVFVNFYDVNNNNCSQYYFHKNVNLDYRKKLLGHFIWVFMFWTPSFKSDTSVITKITSSRSRPYIDDNYERNFAHNCMWFLQGSRKRTITQLVYQTRDLTTSRNEAKLTYLFLNFLKLT